MVVAGAEPIVLGVSPGPNRFFAVLPSYYSGRAPGGDSGLPPPRVSGALRPLPHPPPGKAVFLGRARACLPGCGAKVFRWEWDPPGILELATGR